MKPIFSEHARVSPIRKPQKAQCLVENSHLQNIIGATTRRIAGVNINVGHVQPVLDNVKRACGNGRAWYGWSDYASVGSVSTNFRGNGRAQIRFGNCWDTGIVRAYLNGRLIRSAIPKTMATIQFYFTDGSTLTFRDEGQNSVIQISDLRVISCRGINMDELHS